MGIPYHWFDQFYSTTYASFTKASVILWTCSLNFLMLITFAIVIYWFQVVYIQQKFAVSRLWYLDFKFRCGLSTCFYLSFSFMCIASNSFHLHCAFYSLINLILNLKLTWSKRGLHNFEGEVDTTKTCWLLRLTEVHNCKVKLGKRCILIQTLVAQDLSCLAFMDSNGGNWCSSGEFWWQETLYF